MEACWAYRASSNPPSHQTNKKNKKEVSLPLPSVCLCLPSVHHYARQTGSFFFFKCILRFPFIYCVSVCISFVCECACLYMKRPEKNVRSPGTEETFVSHLMWVPDLAWILWKSSTGHLSRVLKLILPCIRNQSDLGKCHSLVSFHLFCF